MTYVLITERKGDVIDVALCEDLERLKQHAATQDGAPLTWMNFLGNFGAHSNYDEERGYSIYMTRVIT